MFQCGLCGKYEVDTKMDLVSCQHANLCTSCIILFYGDRKAQTCVDAECLKPIADTIYYIDGAMKIRSNKQNERCLACQKPISVGETYQLCPSKFR